MQIRTEYKVPLEEFAQASPVERVKKIAGWFGTLIVVGIVALGFTFTKLKEKLFHQPEKTVPEQTTGAVR